MHREWRDWADIRERVKKAKINLAIKVTVEWAHKCRVRKRGEGLNRPGYSWWRWFFPNIKKDSWKK